MWVGGWRSNPGCQACGLRMRKVGCAVYMIIMSVDEWLCSCDSHCFFAPAAEGWLLVVAWRCMRDVADCTLHCWKAADAYSVLSLWSFLSPCLPLCRLLLSSTTGQAATSYYSPLHLQLETPFTTIVAPSESLFLIL
eukprot:scaffold46872_cov21-Tisochrysis_lutea.AAC.3